MKEEQDRFINPGKYEKIAKEEHERVMKEQEELLMKKGSKKEHQETLDMFKYGERTEHKDVAPAGRRLKTMVRKQLMPSVSDPNMISPRHSATTRLPSRPTTHQVSTRPQTMGSTVRPVTNESAVRFKSSQSGYNAPTAPEYKTFYTTSAAVEFYTSDRIDGKSSYGNYKPSDDVAEQFIEKMWYEKMNKDIMEKRTQEEIKQNLYEWQEAKSRYEGEIARKKENLNSASNFRARGFERKTMPKENFNFEVNPLEQSDGSSLISESEEEEPSDASSDASDKVPRHERIQKLIEKRRCKTAGYGKRRLVESNMVDITKEKGFFPILEEPPKPKKKKKKKKKGAKSGATSRASSKTSKKGKKKGKKKKKKVVKYHPDGSIDTGRP